ncbi:MAG TPA: hypothetical protein VK024_05535 [Actinomycetaceae bacterium]|nr:hypothetical protein [Actinomycetaceae bacterium]
MNREERWENRLAVPVLLAALASVPAVFLTLFSEPYATVGNVVNSLSGAVLIGETVVLLAVSGDKWQWLRRNWLVVIFSFAVLLAVVFAIGPVQLLRLVRVFGAFRIVRAGRIIKAARLLRRRTERRLWANIASVGLACLAVAFVVVVLADPTSASRTLIEGWLGRATTTVLVIVAGVILAGATFVVARARQRRRDPVEAATAEETEKVAPEEASSDAVSSEDSESASP